MARRPLRICFVAYRGNMQCGGQGIYLWFLARELTRLGHAVDVFVGPPYPDPMPFAGEVVQLPNEQFWGRWFAGDAAAMLPRPSPLAIFSPLNFYELAGSYFGFLPEPFAFSIRAFRAVAERLRAGAHYDIVHDVQCLGWGTLGLRALGLPVVSTIHHPLSVDRRASFVRDRSFRDALGSMTFYPIGMQSTVARRLDRIFTSSRVSARQIATDFGVRPSRLAMVANGVDTELYRPDPDAVRNANEILCVGRASDPNKGIETLVEALALLPPEVTVTLVDQDTPENAGRLRAQELGCGDRLNIVGRVSLAELVRLYQHATLVAVPSRYEGFGLPAVEAMACGTAVVACRSGALPEVLAVAGGGLLAERDDPRSLATSIRRLLDHPELRAELGTRGRAGVAAAYAWPRVGEATARVYAEVLALRGRPASTTTSDSPGRLRASQSNASSTL